MSPLGVQLVRLVKSLEHGLKELLSLVSDHPELLDFPDPKGKCPHGKGARRRCRICARDYMREYRQRQAG